MKSLLLVAPIVCLAYIAFVCATRETQNDVPYPEDYRTWAHVKTGVIGPKSPMFEKLGGFHHIYANDKAMKGYQNHQFPQGAILVFDKLELIEDKNGNILEGKRKWVDVMVKDHGYDSTGGWGFEEFTGDSKTDRAVTRLATPKCFTCHTSQKTTDFVFSSLRK